MHGEANWQSSTPRQHRTDLQTRGAVDRYAGEVRGRGEWALHPSRRGAGSSRARHRLSGHHAGRRMEVDADAAIVCREDQCGEVGYGESGGCDWPRRIGLEIGGKTALLTSRSEERRVGEEGRAWG